jgi:hypothetical protein
MSLPLSKPKTSPTAILCGGGVISASLAIGQAPPWMILIWAVKVLLLAGLVAIVHGAIPQEPSDRVSFWKDFWKHWTTRRRDTLAHRQRKVEIALVVPTPRMPAEHRRSPLHERRAGVPARPFTTSTSGSGTP